MILKRVKSSIQMHGTNAMFYRDESMKSHESSGLLLSIRIRLSARNAYLTERGVTGQT